jgi:hypothetical protein
MVKAKQTEVPENLVGNTPKPKPQKAKPLLAITDFIQKFGKIDTQITKYEGISLQIKVTDNDSLLVAENNASQIQQMLNGIELVRSTLKSPYYETGKAIDAYAKTLKEPLERCKIRIGSQITSFKELAAAQERLRIEKEEKAREEKEKKKTAEIEKLARIKQQLYARIYGGIYYSKSGIRNSSVGCQSTEDCDRMQIFIDERFPSPENFDYLKSELVDTKSIGIGLLTEHKANLIELSSNNSDVVSKAREKIAQAKIDAEIEAVDETETLKKGMEKEAASTARADAKNLKEAKKGVREIIKFAIEDPAAVPVDFKVVSESLVNEYIRDNSDRIKQALKDSKQPIPGINFFVDAKFITSG